MKDLYGILFVDHSDVILRVYQADKKEWRLMHYLKKDLTRNKKPQESVSAFEIAQALSEFFATTYAQHIMEWKMFARGVSLDTVTAITSASGFHVELLTPAREQELLGKGMFTEFW